MKLLNAFKSGALLLGVLLCLSAPLHAQVTIDSTTLSANVTATQGTVTVAAVTCTGCTFGNSSIIYVDSEAMCVNGSYVSGTTVPVTRGCLGTAAAAHNIKNQLGNVDTIVFVGPANRFHQGSVSFPGTGDPPVGVCTRASQQFMPWINISNNYVWTCDGTYWRSTTLINVNGGTPSRATQ